MRGSVGRDRFSVRADQFDGLEEEFAGRGFHAWDGLDLRKQRRGHVRTGYCVADDLSSCDDDTGLFVGVGEDTCERLVQGVGEDECPAHHPGAEHDRQGGEDGTGLTSEQAFECDGGHRPLTSCIAARTSAAVTTPWPPRPWMRT